MHYAPDDFTGFNQAHFDRVEKVVRRMFSTRRWPAYVELGDLVQDVALHVAEHLGNFDPGGTATVNTWIERVALNRLADSFDRETAQKRGRNFRHVTLHAHHAEEPGLEELLADDEPGPDDAASNRELAADLARFGGTLRAEQRRTLLAVYREDSLQAAADSLGIARTSLQGRLATIRRLAEDAGLHRWLDPDG